MLDDTVHFAFSVECEFLKMEADLKSRIGAAVTKFPRRCGIRSRPDDSGREYGVRRVRFMGSRVFLGLRGREVQCGTTTQEFGASVEVKAGAVATEVGGERFKEVTSSGRICNIKPDGELKGHPYSLTEVNIFLLV